MNNTKIIMKQTCNISERKANSRNLLSISFVRRSRALVTIAAYIYDTIYSSNDNNSNYT